MALMRTRGAAVASPGLHFRAPVPHAGGGCLPAGYSAARAPGLPSPPTAPASDGSRPSAAAFSGPRPTCGGAPGRASAGALKYLLAVGPSSVGGETPCPHGPARTRVPRRGAPDSAAVGSRGQRTCRNSAPGSSGEVMLLPPRPETDAGCCCCCSMLMSR
jgi:hypothetical protein